MKDLLAQLEILREMSQGLAGIAYRGRQELADAIYDMSVKIRVAESTLLQVTREESWLAMVGNLLIRLGWWLALVGNGRRK